MKISLPVSFANPQVKHALADTNQQLAAFKDRHLGQRAVIIGNGPSLNQMDLSFLKNEVTFGMNRIYLGFEKWGFSPSYYVSVNTLVIEQSAAEMAKIPAPRFLSIYGAPYVENPADFLFLKPVHGPLFTRDPRLGICEGYTVTYVAMQLAYFMGFSEVYLIGVDHNFVTQGPANQEIVSEGADANHFDPNYFGSGFRWQLPDLQNSEVAYRLAKRVFEAEGRIIFDATVGGKLNIFPKVDYRDVFASSPVDLVLSDRQPVSTLAEPEESDPDPLVTLLIHTGEDPAELQITLDSLATQTHPNLEIFLVGPNLPDRESLLTSAGTLTPIIPYPAQVSTAVARKLGLDLARGEFIAFLEAGDRLHPDHLAALTSFLQAHDQFAAAYVTATEVVQTQKEDKTEIVGRTTLNDQPFDRTRLLTTNYLPGASLVYRRTTLLKAGGFEPELNLFANWDMLLRLTARENLIALPISGAEILWRAEGGPDQNAAHAQVRDYLEACRTIYTRHPTDDPAIQQARENYLAAFPDAQTFSPDLGARLWPAVISTHVQKANDLVASGNLQAAHLALAAALALSPHDPWLTVTHANLLQHLDELDAAHAEYFRATQENPEYIPGQLALAAMCYQMGDLTGARLALERVLALNPDDITAQTFLANLDSSSAELSGTPADEVVSPPLSPSLERERGGWGGNGGKVSIIVSTYASAAFMRECLDDLVHQTIAPALDIIIVDAHSPEDEGAIIAEYQAKLNIRYIRTDTRIGVYAAWNLAIQAAQGDYILPFSTNDRLAPYTCETLARALDEHPEVQLVYGDTYLTRTPHETFEHHTRSGMYRWPDYSYEELLQYCQIGPHPMWRRTLHDEIGYFDEKFLSVGDQEFWLRIGERYAMLHIPVFTGLYWDTDNALSKKGTAPYEEIAEIQSHYQRRYLNALREFTARARRTISLPPAERLFHARFGFFPRTKAARETLEILHSLQPGEGSLLLPSPIGSESPRISVLVSTYNSEAYLRPCLEDLEAQTIADQIEIIVIDSGSQQNERTIVEEFQKRYDNILYLRTGRETLYTAWNRGIQLARGQYITNANADDAHHPAALERLAAALDAHPDAGLAFSDYVWTPIPNATTATVQPLRTIVHPPYEPAHALFYCILGCHPMWRRTTFERIGLFDPTYAVVGDYELYLRFVAAGLRPVHVSEILSYFYQNPKGLTYQSGRGSEEVITLLRKYRTEIPIQSLYRVDADPTQIAQAWLAQGNLALNCPVPWVDVPHQDHAYALYCFQKALETDSHFFPAVHNLITLLDATQESEKAQKLLALLPAELATPLAEALQRGEHEIISATVPPAVEPLIYATPIASSAPVTQGAHLSKATTDIVIPIYGQPDLLRRCVASVLATTLDDVHLILVDDCTPGGDITALFETWHDHPRVTLARTSTNQGFIGTCKLGASLGKAPYLLFLNSDTEALTPGWLTHLLPTEEDIAVTGARLLYPADMPGPLRGTIQHAGIARNPAGVPYHPFLGQPVSCPQANQRRDVNAVTGACFLIRRAVWENLSGWDAAFGRGVYEDVDLCWRVRQSGYRVQYRPEATLIHHESASKAADGSHSLNAHTQENLLTLQSRWAYQESDEALFIGAETARKWNLARKKIQQAQTFFAQKQFYPARIAASQAANLAPTLPEAALAFAQLLSHLGEHSRAIAYYQQALQSAPANWEARLRLIDEFITTGDPTRAAEELAHLQAVYPTHPKVQQRAEMLALFMPGNGNGKNGYTNGNGKIETNLSSFPQPALVAPAANGKSASGKVHRRRKKTR
ncbi:MAG: glycosyltransferase [Anaerolineales bacterium]|nr:glycosyltransferase [Anaerolineales bacterium]